MARRLGNVWLWGRGVDTRRFDLATFSPDARGAGRSGVVRRRGADVAGALRALSAEKKPQRSLTTLATLRAEGMPVRLVVAGGGPPRTRLGRRAARAGLPVTFTGWAALLGGTLPHAEVHNFIACRFHALLATFGYAVGPGIWYPPSWGWRYGSGLASKIRGWKVRRSSP